MKFRALTIALAAATAVLLGVLPTSPQAASATSQTIDLDLTLSDAVTLDATVTADKVVVEDDTVTVSGSLEGVATVLGKSVTIDAQPFTLTAATTCRRGTGTLSLDTTEIDATVDGRTVSISPATVTATASCGKTPSLDVTAQPLTASIGDATVSTSKCTVSVESEAGSPTGSALCDVKELICELAELLDDPNATSEDIVAQLDTVLAGLDDALTL
jgi:Fe-S-cluster formation regulator IscX/YfhJ